LKKILTYSPCIVLAIVALSQIYLTHTDRLLTPAKGGGFGMFSTVDKLYNRVALIYAFYGKQKVDLTAEMNPFFKQGLSNKWQTARSYPTDAHLKELAESLKLLSFSRPPDSILIEVKKCIFDTESNWITYALVNEITIPYDQIDK
jgi:hypothetical protein